MNFPDISPLPLASSLIVLACLIALLTLVNRADAKRKKKSLAHIATALAQAEKEGRENNTRDDVNQYQPATLYVQNRINR